jgi:hypothetical protein
MIRYIEEAGITAAEIALDVPLEEAVALLREVIESWQ